MTKRNQLVIPRGDQWAVRGDGTKRDTELFDRKQGAVDRARGISQNQKWNWWSTAKTGVSRIRTATAMTLSPRKADRRGDASFPACGSEAPQAALVGEIHG